MIPAIIGGILIGTAANLLWIWNERILGVSGIARGLLTTHVGDRAWRLAFLLGIIASGAFLSHESLEDVAKTSTWSTSDFFLLGAYLVGVGTALANGCTSGHGVCGVARLSHRSIVATLIFVFTAFIFASLRLK